MPARCIAHLPTQASRAWLLREDDAPYELGRDEASALFLDDDRVSRRHARFVYDGGWRVEDLGSKNGLVVDGTALATAPLGGTHWIDAGGVVLRFEVLDEGAAARRAEEELSRWRSSHACCRELDPTMEPEEILERLLASALRLSGLERGFVLRRRPAASAEDELEVVAQRGLELSDLASPRFRGSVGAVEKALAEGRSVATTDASLDTWLGERASVLTGGIRGLACLPLKVDEELIGALYADSRRPGAAVTELDLEILGALADHAALVLSLAALRRELDDLEREAARGLSAPRTERSWRRLVAAPEEATA